MRGRARSRLPAAGAYPRLARARPVGPAARRTASSSSRPSEPPGCAGSARSSTTAQAGAAPARRGHRPVPRPRRAHDPQRPSVVPGIHRREHAAVRHPVRRRQLFLGITFNGSLIAAGLLLLILSMVLLSWCSSACATDTRATSSPTRRIMRISGIVSRRAHSIPWVRVTDLTIEQSLTGRLFGYATPAHRVRQRGLGPPRPRGRQRSDAVQPVRGRHGGGQAGRHRADLGAAGRAPPQSRPAACGAHPARRRRGTAGTTTRRRAERAPTPPAPGRARPRTGRRPPGRRRPTRRAPTRCPTSHDVDRRPETCRADPSTPYDIDLRAHGEDRRDPTTGDHDGWT